MYTIITKRFINVTNKNLMKNKISKYFVNKMMKRNSFYKQEKYFRKKNSNKMKERKNNGKMGGPNHRTMTNG